MGNSKWLKGSKINFVFSIFVTIFSAFIYSLGVVVFISNAKLMASGVSGISLIIGRIFEEANLFNFTEAQISGVFYFVINIPILVLSFRKFSWKFTILTILHMIFTSLFTSLINPSIVYTFLGVEASWPLSNQLESAFFSGVLCGFSTAITYLVGGSSAGIDLLSLYLSSKKQISTGKINAIVNGIIIFVTIILWPNNIINALFTLIFIFINAAVIDLIFVANKKVIITIITEKGDEIANMINQKFTRGVTRIKAIGNYSKREKDFLYTACTSTEALEIAEFAMQIDEHSFTSISTAQRINGYFLNKQTKS